MSGSGVRVHCARSSVLMAALARTDVHFRTSHHVVSATRTALPCSTEFNILKVRQHFIGIFIPKVCYFFIGKCIRRGNHMTLASFFLFFLLEIWYITYKIDDTLDIIQFKVLRNRIVYSRLLHKVSIVILTCVALRTFRSYHRVKCTGIMFKFK